VNDEEMRTMLIEYMGKGFLENIIALMKQDPETVRFIPSLMADDALVVRLGATALVEELAREHRHALSGAVPGLLELLGHENPTIRGDAANVLGVIGERVALGPLLRLRDNDANASVREIAADAVREIEGRAA
jgi:HEAT repeat protein